MYQIIAIFFLEPESALCLSLPKREFFITTVTTLLVQGGVHQVSAITVHVKYRKHLHLNNILFYLIDFTLRNGRAQTHKQVLFGLFFSRLFFYYFIILIPLHVELF